MYVYNVNELLEETVINASNLMLIYRFPSTEICSFVWGKNNFYNQQQKHKYVGAKNVNQGEKNSGLLVERMLDPVKQRVMEE